MRHTFNGLLAFVFIASVPRFTAAQDQASSVLELTVDRAVTMAVDQNVDLAAARIDPQIGDARVAAAAGAFRPVFSTSVLRNNQLQPPTSFLIPEATRTDVVTSSMALSQRVKWFGTIYSVAWDTSHTDSNSFLNSYNPLLRSGLSLNISQPLLRDFSIDSSRFQLDVSQRNRTIADTRLRETQVQITANVKSAYWGLVAAQENVDAKRTALVLAEELARTNKAKVDVGQSPPLDLASAQAEVAANQEQLIIAETAVRTAEDRLRGLIYDPTDRDIWNIKLKPVDAPPLLTSSVDLDAAVTNALRDRTDLVRARSELENSAASVKLASNQRLPDLRVNGAYQASGLGGTEVLRTGGFPGTVVGDGRVTAFGSVLDQLLRNDFPTWSFGVTLSYPIGRSQEEANYARTRLEQTQAEARIKGTAGRVIQQVREAGWKIDMNSKRIDTTRAARDLAEQRLNAERRRFDAGLSTSFLVIQAQRDLAQARTNELAAVLAYDLSLVEFEAIQQAPPAGQAAVAAAVSQASAAPAPTAATAIRSATAASVSVPGLIQ